MEQLYRQQIDFSATQWNCENYERPLYTSSCKPTFEALNILVYKILKQISKDLKETARIQGNIEENTFLQYYGKLWNTTNINEIQLE